MEKELEKWLSNRRLSKKTLKVLIKEELVATGVISRLREDDIQQLSTKHSLTMGETVLLREARDAILRGEYLASTSRGVDGAPAVEEDDGLQRGEKASAPGVSSHKKCAYHA